MPAITADLVKQLRDRTDAGMMDCKRALVEADGDMEKAVDVLRKAGIAKAEKKSSRSTNEGRIASYINNATGVLVEVLCETDFVAKNEKFQAYLEEVSARIADYSETGDVSAQVQEREAEAITALIATIGENMQLRRAVRWQSAGACASYLHMGGRIGVMIDAEGDVSKHDALNDICMHIAAFRPQYINPDEIPADVIAREKEVAAGQVQGKPAEIVEKIVSGKINKWYTEACLMQQPWLRDDKLSVEKANSGIKIKQFLRWEVGEEI